MQDGQETKEIITSESSFLVKIKYRQNSSWQGTVQWVESGKTQNFKSCLELIRLMDSAVGGPESEKKQKKAKKSEKQ